MNRLFKLYIVLLIQFSILISQNIPVTLHYKPEHKNFTTLRLVGTFNGWNNNDDALIMTDIDKDGEYSITTNLAIGVDHNYKFVMDANWGLAYNDPNNPRINLADNNNSMLLVKDPMITYLLPRDINSNNKEYLDTTMNGEPIRIVIANSTNNLIDPSKIKINIDGVEVENPSQYYNAAKGEIYYKTAKPLEVGQHKISVKIFSAIGSDSAKTTFTRNPNIIIYYIPTDFYYDQNNKSVSFMQNLQDVSVVGGFNNWNDMFNPMVDVNKNGVWETTVQLIADEYKYKFKLNKIAWINDPDNPNTEPIDGNNLIVVKIDSIPTIKLISPEENLVFLNDTTFDLKFKLRPGVKSKGIDSASVTVKVDSVLNLFNYNSENNIFISKINISGEGRHTIKISFKNKEGIEAAKLFSFGIFKSPKNKYFIDDLNDQQYLDIDRNIPASDILSVGIFETKNHDSLKFSIKMRKIADRTRIGLVINNPSNNFIDDPRRLELKIPNWNGQGVFASLGKPGNNFENLNVENKFMISNNPAKYDSNTIQINSEEINNEVFEFKISLAFLNKYLGGWTNEREFSIFSYYANFDKSGNAYEVGLNEGGVESLDEPDVYDAAFIRNGFWQNRILRNYLEGKNKFAIFDGKGRGTTILRAEDFSDSLSNKENFVKFLTPPETYWYKNLVIHGIITDKSIKTFKFVLNGVETNYNNNDSGKFAIPIVLNEGENKVFIKILDSNNVATNSKDLILNFIPDKKPQVNLDGTFQNREITLTSIASSPINEILSYAWESDVNNPSPISISSLTNIATFTLPKVNGKYIFKSIVSDAKGNTEFSKIVINTKGDSIKISNAEDNYHAEWIDSAIVYEIFPRSFSAQGGFKGITENIEKIKSLGVNTIWFMPVFEGPTTHGYEIIDYYKLESEYGNDEDFNQMIQKLKQNEMKIILDLVVNHTGVGHPMMQNIFKYKSYSPWADFYLWSGEPGNSNYKFYFDWSSLPNLNFNNKDVRKYFIDVSKFWIEKYGLNGYRCDVAWGVEERNNVFWKEWRKSLKGIDPNLYLLAEANSNDNIFYQNRFESAYDWDLRSYLFGVMNGTKTINDLHNQIVRPTTKFARPFRFIDNHDETRAITIFDSKRSLMLNSIIFTLNGIPLIYSGSEVGEKTTRGPINWTDPENLKPYFKRLVEIRKKYIHNPKIIKIKNSDSLSIYSYVSNSDDKNIITIVNFKNAGLTPTFDFSNLPFDGKSNYYLSNLITGKVQTITPSNRNNFSFATTSFSANIFHYGLDSITVINEKILTNVYPNNFTLFQNYPNPFNNSTIIRYQIPVDGKVSIKLYDMLGKEIAVILNNFQEKGNHLFQFNASGLPSGVYFYKVEAGNFKEIKKMILMK